MMFQSQKQKGAVLIVSLVLLIIMTLLGLSSMNNTVMEERMSGNLRNYYLAFQSSESALRAGENVIGAYTGKPIASSSSNTALFTLDGPDNDPNDATAWWQVRDADWWASNARTYTTNLAFTNTANLIAPQYVIEESEVVQDSINVGQQQDFGGRQYYQVTSRGSGSAGRAVVLLRSTYARRF